MRPAAASPLRPAPPRQLRPEPAAPRLQRRRLRCRCRRRRRRPLPPLPERPRRRLGPQSLPRPQRPLRPGLALPLWQPRRELEGEARRYLRYLLAGPRRRASGRGRGGDRRAADREGWTAHGSGCVDRGGGRGPGGERAGEQVGGEAGEEDGGKGGAVGGEVGRAERIWEEPVDGAVARHAV